MISVHKKRNIRVYQIWDEYLPIFTGAVTRYDQIMPLLREQGIQVEVLTPKWDGLNLDETINETPIHRVPTGPFRNKYLKFIFNSLFLCRELWTRRHKFDILHSLSTNEFRLPVFLIGKFLGKPVILEYTLLRSKDISFFGKLLKITALRFYRKLDAYICLSSVLKNSIIQAGLPIEKCHQIPYGVFPDIFIPKDGQDRKNIRKQLGLKHDACYLIFVGSFIKRKGIDILIETMARVYDCRNDVHLIVVGQHDFPEGHPARPFAEAMKEEIKTRGLEKNITLVGLANYDQVLQWLQASDIFVFPSRREGLGRVILEAMSVGLPCVCSSLDGISYDMINSGANGIIVEDLDARAFSEQILTLAKDRDLSTNLGINARETVIRRFDEKAIVKEYKQLYGALLASNKSTIQGEHLDHT